MIKLITTNDIKNLKLKAIFDEENMNQNITKSHGKVTLIDSEKTLYVYFKKADLSFHELHNWIKTFTSSNDKNLDIDVASFTNENLSEELTLQAILEGILFTQHNAISYKTTESQTKPQYNVIYEQENGEEILKLANIKLASVNLSRDLQDEAPNIMTPAKFAEKIQENFANLDNVKITILDKSAIEAEKMGLLLSVAKGSHNEPRLVVIEYLGDSSNNSDKIGLVGKGITFDSGGYSLKDSNSMINMKFDMSGAAIVCSTMLAIAKLKPKINLVAVACLTENRIGGHATLVESVITSMNGKTIEILNTDAEGRLVLADGITYAIRNKQATKIIELSTLTGAMLITLGHHLVGAFSNNDEFYKEFSAATKLSQEKIWRLPILKENLEEMKSEVADLANIGTTRYMGSSQAAAFLESFAEKKPFIHLDIAGTANIKNRGTGVMVKTLIEFLKK